MIARISDPTTTDSKIKEHETRELNIQWNRIVELEVVPRPSLEGLEYYLWLQSKQALYDVENLIIAPGYNQNSRFATEVS